MPAQVIVMFIFVCLLVLLIVFESYPAVLGSYFWFCPLELLPEDLDRSFGIRTQTPALACKACVIKQWVVSLPTCTFLAVILPKCDVHIFSHSAPTDLHTFSCSAPGQVFLAETVMVVAIVSLLWCSYTCSQRFLTLVLAVIPGSYHSFCGSLTHTWLQSTWKLPARLGMTGYTAIRQKLQSCLDHPDTHGTLEIWTQSYIFAGRFLKLLHQVPYSSFKDSLSYVFMDWIDLWTLHNLMQRIEEKKGNKRYFMR